MGRENPAAVRAGVTDPYIERLIADVTKGFGGDVGIVPRHFLRRLTLAMDTVDENPEYDPMDALDASGVHVDAEELARATGKLPNEDDDDSLMGEEAVW